MRIEHTNLSSKILQRYTFTLTPMHLNVINQ